MRYLLGFLFTWVVVGSVAVWPFQFNPTTKQNEANTYRANQETKQPVPIPIATKPPDTEKETSKIASESEPKSVRITGVSSPDAWYKAYVIATIILVIIGIGGVVMAYKTLRQIKAQSDVLVNMERAWLHAEPISDTPEQKMVSTFTDYPVDVTNYGRTVGEIVSYMVSAGSKDRIEELFSDRGQSVSLGKLGRRFVAPWRTQTIFSFSPKQIFEYAGLWDDIGSNQSIGIILIEILYCDVLNRQTIRSSRFLYQYDPDVLQLNILPEYTEYR